MILRFMLMLINVVGLCALPESEIELVDTGYSYRFEMALGYGQYLKTGKVRAVRFSTLDAICDVLDCQPGDILEYQREEKL